MLLTKDKETLVLFPPGKANDKFTLLAPSISKIGDYAFYQNENLKNVVIPNRVTSLGKRSFGLCPNLNTVTLLCDNLISPANIHAGAQRGDLRRRRDHRRPPSSTRSTCTCARPSITTT